MKTYETSTQIAPIIYVGTYDSLLSYESMFSYQEDEEHEEGRFVCNNFDWGKYKNTIVETANRIFAEERPLENHGVKSIVAIKMGSPQYYNYITDWLELKVEVEDDFLDRAEKVLLDPKNEKVIDEFMAACWRTRDGYLSRMPAERISELPEVFRMLREDDCGIDDMRAFGTVLMLLMVVDGPAPDIFSDQPMQGSEFLTDRLAREIQDNCYISDYCTVLERDEAQKRYGGIIWFDTFDEAEKQLTDGLERYKSCGVSAEAVADVESEVKRRLERIDKYRDEIREAIEYNHDNEAKVREILSDVRDDWMNEFGECPTRATLGSSDPNQLELPL